MRVQATAVVLLVTALAGCGPTTSASKDFTGEKARVADKIGDLQTAGRQRKAADVCDDIVTSDLKGKLAAPGSSCSQEMKKALDDADAFDLAVTDVQITGPKATATVKTKDIDKDVTRTFELSKQGSGWRISSFG